MKPKALTEIQEEYCGFVYERPDEGPDPIEEGYVRVHLLTKQSPDSAAMIVASDEVSASPAVDSGGSKSNKKLLSCQTCLYNGNLCKGKCIIKGRKHTKLNAKLVDKEDLLR